MSTSYRLLTCIHIAIGMDSHLYVYRMLFCFSHRPSAKDTMTDVVCVSTRFGSGTGGLVKEDDTATTSTERDEMSGSGGDDLLVGKGTCSVIPMTKGRRLVSEHSVRHLFAPVSSLLKPSAHRHQQRARAFVLIRLVQNLRFEIDVRLTRVFSRPIISLAVPWQTN